MGDIAKRIDAELPATIEELKEYVGVRKAHHAALVSFIRTLPDIPETKAWRDKTIKKGIVGTCEAWYGEARIGDLLPPAEVGAGRGNKINIPNVNFNHHDRAFARACQRARDSEKLNTILEKHLADLTLPRWQEPLGQAHTDKYTGNVENYTPKEVIDRVREVLGEIDLDPASCELAQKIVQAKEYYTIEDNGLDSIRNKR